MAMIMLSLQAIFLDCGHIVRPFQFILHLCFTTLTVFMQEGYCFLFVENFQQTFEGQEWPVSHIFPITGIELHFDPYSKYCQRSKLHLILIVSSNEISVLDSRNLRQMKAASPFSLSTNTTKQRNSLFGQRNFHSEIYVIDSQHQLR